MLTEVEQKIKNCLSDLHRFMIDNSSKGNHTYEEDRALRSHIEAIETAFLISVGKRVIRESNKKNEGY